MFATSFHALKRFLVHSAICILLPSGLAAQNSRPGDFLNLPVIGNQKIIFLRVKYPGDSGGSISTSAAESQANTLKQTISENSYGKASLTIDITPVLALPQPQSYYEKEPVLTRIRADAVVMAEQAGFDINSYDRVVIFTKKVWIGPMGKALNEQTAFLSGGTAYLTAHEIGHTYGWLHANFWQVKQGSPISPNGVNVEYGDVFDIMGDRSGNNRKFHHFNPWYKIRAGWIPPQNVLDVTESGTYTIQAFEKVPDAGSPVTKFTCLRIMRDTVKDYWIFYRSKENDINYGPVITWGYHTNFFPSRLLDMTPGSKGNDWQDAALKVGETFSDPGAGIAVKAVQRTQDKVVVEVTFNRPAVDNLPVIDALKPARGDIASGTVEYEVTAFDPDFGNSNGSGIEKVEAFLVRSSNDPLIFSIWAQEPVGNSPGVLAAWEFSSPPFVWQFDTHSNPFLKDGFYAVAIRATSNDGNANTILFKQIIDNTGPSIPTSIQDNQSSMPRAYTLHQNYPNPFNPSTKILYTLPQSGFVRLDIFNTMGQEIESLVNAEQRAGKYEIQWRPGNTPGGLYFYRLQVHATLPSETTNSGHSSPLFAETKKLILLK
ncbi:MAG: hypothetical protein ACE5I1_14545 [bacterium]